MSSDHFSSESASRKRVPLVWRKKPLISAMALALMGSVALPVSGWAGTYTGTAFYDLNGNGTFDPCEFPLSNKQIFVTDNGNTFIISTDSSGNYTYSSSNSGVKLWIEIPYGQSLTSPTIATSSYAIYPSNSNPINFGFYNPNFKNTPPTVTIGNVSPIKAEVGKSINFTAAFSDPEGDPLCPTTVPEWDFGDGASTTGLNAVYSYNKPGTYTATIKVIDRKSGIGEASVNVTVESPAKPQIQVSTSTVNFGNKVVNSRNYQYIAISNTGNAPLQIGTLNMSGVNTSDFSMYYNQCNNKTLAPSQRCYTYTYFQPTSTGQKSATLVIPSNSVTGNTRSGKSIENVTLDGTGNPPPDGSKSKQQWCEDATASDLGKVITVHAVTNNGKWFDESTWSTGKIPDSNDVVFIPANITVTGPEPDATNKFIEIGALCNKGIIKGNILTTSTGKKTNSLEIYATNTQYGISNYETIKGADGSQDSSLCGTVGGDVLLIAGKKEIIQSPKRGDWWWTSYSGGGPIYNTGLIQGGNGGDDMGGTCTAETKKGGNAIVLGRNTANIPNGTGETGIIRAGNGGSDLVGSNPGGNGGLTQVWGKLGGKGDLVSTGSILGGNGGNGSVGGKGGNLWLVSLPDVFINGKAAGDATHKPGDGGNSDVSKKGSLTIEPSSITVTNTSLTGGKVTIFGGDDWTLDLHQMKGAITSESDITLAVGKGGVIDLTGNNKSFLRAKGKLTIYSDAVFMDDGVKLEDLIQASEIVTGPAKILREVSLTGVNQLLGKPGETHTVQIKLANNGAEMDNYTIKVSDSAGWTLSELPGEVPVDALDIIGLPIKVTMPMKESAANTITITATSQAEPSVSTTMVIKAATVVEKTTHTIFGTLKDKRGNPIANATIQVGDQTVVTDEQGTWELADLLEGNHTVSVTKENFVFSSQSVELNADSAEKVEITFSTDKEPYDLWVRDPSPDDGSEPGKASRIWVSPDVWVRNQADGIKSYQNVKFGQDNYVYVNVRNIGTLTAKNTKVEVYRSGASMGQSWPNGWGLVGTADIASLSPDTSDVVQIKWNKDNIPKPGHYCFYVRVLNDDDPMFAAETNNMVQNTKTNNNIAWRNFNVVGYLTKVKDNFDVEIGNPKDTDTVVEVVFEEKEQLLANDGARAIVDLGDTLFKRWQDAGSQGENIKVLSGTEVELLATPAKFTGISLKVGESLPMTMRVEVTKPMPGAGTSRTYNFSAQEFIGEELIGGVDYAITTRAQDTDSDGDGIKDVVDDDNDNDGIPDEWETDNGLNPLGSSDADEDSDGDGISNLDEFRKGTDPTDSTSAPEVFRSFGTLRDAQGNPIANATVQIGDQTVTTDAAGNWEITGLFEGEYTVTASKNGYILPEQTFEVGQGEHAKVEFDVQSMLSLSFKPSTYQPIKQGSNITYTAIVTNKGDATATGTNLEYLLPEGMEVVSMSVLEGNSCDTSTATCTLPDLTPGASVKVEIVAKAVGAGTLVNQVQVSGDNYPTDSAKRWTKVNPFFSVSPVDTPDPVETGKVLHYNYGVDLNEFADKVATNVQLATSVPRGTSLQNISTTQGSCDTSELPKVTCSLGDLDNSTAESISHVTVTMDVQLDDPGLLLLANEASVTSADYDTHRAKARTKIVLPKDVAIDLAIVVDTTNSMTEERNGTVNGIKQFIDTNMTGNMQVALIEFKDETNLTVSTSDINLLKQAVENIVVEGGGMCPEASVESLDVAVELVKEGGHILFVTDASPYEDADMEGLAQRIKDKNITVTAILTGDCSEGENSWNDVAAEQAAN